MAKGKNTYNSFLELVISATQEGIYEGLPAKLMEPMEKLVGQQAFVLYCHLTSATRSSKV
jgi:hypothetical protein